MLCEVQTKTCAIGCAGSEVTATQAALGHEELVCILERCGGEAEFGSKACRGKATVDKQEILLHELYNAVMKRDVADQASL